IWLLNRTFFRPINRVIESREKEKGGQGSEADNILREAGNKESEYNKAVLDARSQGYEIIEKEHAAAGADRETNLSTAKAELADQMSKGKADLENQSAAARSTIASEAEALADQIASHILKG